MFALRAVCLWPGLPAAWGLGLARGLLTAVVFSWFLCFLLLATFVWPDWIGSGLLRLLWMIASLTWLYAAVRNHMNITSLLEVSDAECAQAFIDAQVEYLRGNWFEAEAILLEILHRHPRDAEATLLLVGVLRHTKRWSSALRRLEQLELIDGAAAWRFEIEREKGLIQRIMADDTVPDGGDLADPDAATPSPEAFNEESAEDGKLSAG
jgi:hypothetical protein